MDFFNKLGETIANKSKEVAQSARDVKDMASLKAKIGQQESRIKNWYQVIGEKVYRAEKDQKHSALETEFSMITDAFAEIGRLKKEMEKIKGVKTCPSCKAEVDDSVNTRIFWISSSYIANFLFPVVKFPTISPRAVPTAP